MYKDKRGFTLVELMIVVAVAAALASMVFPKIQNYQNKAKTTQAKVGLSRLYQDMLIMKQEHGLIAPCLNLLGFRFPPPELNASRYTFGFGYLGYVPYRGVYDPFWESYFDTIFPGYSSLSCLVLHVNDPNGTDGQYAYLGGRAEATHHSALTTAGIHDIYEGEFTIGAASNLTEDFTDPSDTPCGDPTGPGCDKVSDYWTIDHNKNINHIRLGY